MLKQELLNLGFQKPKPPVVPKKMRLPPKRQHSDMRTSIKLDFDEDLVETRPIPEYIFKTEKELGSYTTPTPKTRAGTTDGFSYFIKSHEVQINNLMK